MTDLDPMHFTVEGLSAAFASGQLSPVEATEACLRRIEELNPKLNAFVRVDAQGALAAARDSEQRWRSRSARSALDGVPIAIKDSMALAGWPTLKGSLHSSPDKLAATDSPAAGRLKDDGAVVLGKTCVPEFAWKGCSDSPLTGLTRNPWNPERTAGGSSSGSAVAVATGMAVLATGTDGGGSVRMPAGFCGIVGLKPTFAIVPIYPPSTGGLLSHVGPLTRTVRDAAHMMASMARPDDRDVYPSAQDQRSWLDTLEGGVEGMRIAFSPAYSDAKVDPQIAAAARASVDALVALGAVVDEVDPDVPSSRDEFLTIWDALLARTLAGVPEDRWSLSDPGLVETVHRGRAISAQEFLDAETIRIAVTAGFTNLLHDYDLLISPQLPVLAFAFGSDVPDPATQSHWVDWTPFSYPHNLSRLPALAVPMGLSSDGLPMSLQVVGRHFDDRRVLRAARALEIARPFPMFGA
jgi:aspartyl-tRNA(Asn)/glutamyl-tRNA(Gln) amidotransferase subunit A